MVREHRGEYPSQWAAIESIAPKIGCTSQTLPGWVKREEVDSGEREGVSMSERARLEVLERERKELRRANEILKLANTSAFATASAWPKRASNRRSATGATAMTTPWLKRSTACGRLN